MSEEDWYGDAPQENLPEGGSDGGASGAAGASGNGPVEAAPGLMAGDFVNGEGVLGMRRVSQPDSLSQLAALRSPDPSASAAIGPIQKATQAVNGVPLAIYQPQPSQTGAGAVGDVGALLHSLANLSPGVLERLSNANIPFISVPNSTDQAFPNSNLLQQHPQGWDPDKDWGDVPGGYVDFSKSKSGLSPNDPWRAVVVGPQNGTSSYDVGDHETGHAWDTLSGVKGRAASQLPEFQAAYLADIPNILTQAEAGVDEAKTRGAYDPAHDGDYYYYLQGRSGDVDVGAKETYAETFARYMAGDPSLQTDWPALYNYWQAQDQAQGLRSTSSQRAP